MAGPWTRRYDVRVPASLAPYPETTLVDFVREHAAAAPTSAAVIFKGRSLTWSELDELSSRFASSLSAAGVRAGDRIALILPNCPQFLIAELGAWKVGAAVLPLNPLYTPDELVGPLRASGAAICVALTPFYERVKEVQPHTALRRVIATNIKEFFPMPLRWAFTALKEKKGGHRINLKSGDWRFADCLKAPVMDPIGTQPDADAVMLLSGGTSGTPKIAIGRHRHLVAAGLQLHAWLDHKPDDVALVPLPLFHVYACVGAQSHAIVSRTPLAIVPNPRDLDDLLNTISRVKPTLFSCVPALFIAMLNHPRVTSKQVNFGSIRASFSGAAPLMAATKERFESLTGGRIVEGYSLTEAMMACVINPLEGVNKIGSVGLPLPDVEIAIVDPINGGESLPQGVIGEILIRAPQLMAGYLNDDRETNRTIRRHGEGRPWLHTGDLGYLDEDSYLFIVDRQKDLIKTSGLQVWPREVEEAIASHPAVAEVGVAGIPDPVKGEAVKAWVVRHPSATVTVDDLRRHCRERLAPFKVPSHIEFRESLPRTMTGKVLRRALKAERP